MPGRLLLGQLLLQTAALILCRPDLPFLLRALFLQSLNPGAQVIVFLLQTLLNLRRLTGSLFNIVDDILLVEATEGNTFEDVVFHFPTAFLIYTVSTLPQNAHSDKSFGLSKKN